MEPDPYHQSNPRSDNRDVAGVEHIPFPWDRQSGETSKAYEAFCVYRDLPVTERSIEGASARLYRVKPGSHRGHVEMWSAKNRWVDRAAAWDQECDRRKREVGINEMAEMARLHARVAATQVDALSRPATELLRRIDQEPQLLEQASTSELFSMVVAASRAIPGMANLDRVSRADPQAKRIPTLDAGQAASEPRSLLDDLEDAAAAYRALRDAGVAPLESEEE